MSKETVHCQQPPLQYLLIFYGRRNQGVQRNTCLSTILAKFDFGLDVFNFSLVPVECSPTMDNRRLETFALY